MAPGAYPSYAAQHVISQLRAQGKRVKSVDEAVRRGLLTDLEWCAVLDEFRERYGAYERSCTDHLFPVVQRALPDFPRRKLA